MATNDLKCPQCGAIFPLSEIAKGELESALRKRYEEQLASDRFTLRQDMEKRIQFAKEEATKVSSKKLEETLADLRTVEQELDRSRSQEAELRRERRELEEKTKSLELEVERRLDAERSILRQKVASEVEQEYHFRNAEKDKRIADMLLQIESLKRQATQGSQQTQGEVLELQLEDQLRTGFPLDEIQPVAKGVRGGDILQIVRNQTGKDCGKILWELKRTKSFSDGWISKLKEDAVAAKADLCLLVTETMPSSLNGKPFGEYEGVWVSSIPAATSVVFILRNILHRVTYERSLRDNQREKSSLVYEYITSQDFRSRMEIILLAFQNMQDDLMAERRAMEKAWTKREKSLQQIVLNTSGFYGDLEALVGSSIPKVKMLELES